MGFQNCSRSGLGPEMMGVNDINQIAIGKGVTGVGVPASPVTAVQIPTDSGPLTVQADTGQITVVNSLGQILVEACLSNNELIELQSYTKTYNLCSGAHKADICSQNYTPGYASLIIDNQKLNLGESFDGCGTGLKDFCGSQAQSFRGLVSYIVNNLSSMKCQ